MKKWFCLAGLLCLLTLAACGSDAATGAGNTPAATQSQPTATPTPRPAMTAQQIVQALKDTGLPIGDITAITESTDSQHLMNKPNEYTSMATFVDARITQDQLTGMLNKSIAPGGGIEVFKSANDAKARLSVIESLTKSLNLPETDYQEGVVLLRLSNILTADQAKEYDTKLQSILK